MVNEGIALNASLNSNASTKDNTSTEQQDGSSSSEHVVNAERARVDKVVSDVENTDVRPSYDKNTLNEIQEKVFAIATLKNELRKSTGNIDVKNDLSKPVTLNYLPKVREPDFAKLHHVITSSESRNSSKNMPRFSSNDIVHNHYLEEAKKKTHERDRNSKTSVIPSARLQNTTNGSKPKPGSTNQMTRN
ncbi:hypothetical protein Tco_0195479 [Tanacetum coccineum]